MLTLKVIKASRVNHLCLFIQPLDVLMVMLISVLWCLNLFLYVPFRAAPILGANMYIHSSTGRSGSGYCI